VLLLGHSLGGPIVARVAADHPERIAAVLLLAASLDPGLEAIHPMQWVGALAPVHLLLPRSIGNANAELIALKPELETLATLLHKVTAPVFIVHGTKDTLVPVANVPFMQGRFSGARCINTELLEGRNHFLPWNSAEVVRRAIQKALEAAC
jgi:pimeloyl-ACP methyl ester carboxylesterase